MPQPSRIDPWGLFETRHITCLVFSPSEQDLLVYTFPLSTPSQLSPAFALMDFKLLYLHWIMVYTPDFSLRPHQHKDTALRESMFILTAQGKSDDRSAMKLRTNSSLHIFTHVLGRSRTTVLTQFSKVFGFEIAFPWTQK
jgi:hypothetical protein